MKPILFSTPMVQAILDGRKTQTRRVIKFPLPDNYNVHRFDGINEDGLFAFAWGVIVPGLYLDGGCEVKAPYSVGDVLWVRETWKPQDYFYVDDIMSCQIIFKAGGPDNLNPRVSWNHGEDTIFESCGTWHPSIHMPREAARLFLRVTSVRVERVQDIFKEPTGPNSPIVKEGFSYGCDFIATWDSLNAKRGYGWDSNPWVWVITFERITKEDAVE